EQIHPLYLCQSVVWEICIKKSITAMNIIIFGVLLSIICAESANILCFFSFPSYSHQIVYQAIWKELSLRGHNVVVITPNPLNDTTLGNLTEIDVEFSYKFVNRTEVEDVFGKEVNMLENLDAMFSYLGAVAGAQLQSSQVQKLILDQSS